MAEAFIVDALRTPTGKRKGSLACRCTAPTSARMSSRPRRAQRHSPRGLRRRDLRLRRHHRPAGRRHRPHRVAGRRPADERARHHGRPPVRLLAAGGALRRAGSDERHPGRGAGRRRADHDQIPISSAMLAGQPLGFTTRSPEQGLAGALRRRPGQPVLRRAAHRRPLGAQPRGPGGLCQGEPRPRAACDRRGRFDREVVALRRLPHGRDGARQHAGEDGQLQPVDPAYPKITAAVSSQTCDAASAVLVVSEAALKRYGLKPRARIHHLSVRAPTTRSGTSPRRSPPRARALQEVRHEASRTSTWSRSTRPLPRWCWPG
jgi:acetyl-CoA C-acetyltransferase